MAQRAHVGHSGFDHGSKELFRHLDEVQVRLRAASRVCLFLDVDGMTPGGEWLEPLMCNQRFAVAVIDRCSLPELKARVNIPGVTYVANDGLEIEGPGLRFTERGASECQNSLRTLAEVLRERLSSFPDTRVIDRSLVLTVVAGSDRTRVDEVVGLAVAEHGNLFQLTGRGADIEIGPRVSWSKGLAAQWLVAASGTPDALALYIGDDETDEDAFTSMCFGVTIKVGGRAHSGAHYHMAHSGDMERFLSWLAGN